MVLEALAQLPQGGLAELAQQVKLPASTTFRLLETLQKRGFASQSEQTGQYRLGVRAFEVGSAFLPRLRLNDVALPVMRELMREVGETVNVAVRDQADAVYVAQVEGERMLRMFTRLGARTPTYCSGVGKVLLAWLPQASVRALLGPGPWAAYTDHTITTLEALEPELMRARDRGYSVDNEERELGVRCVAVPITDAAGEVVAALSVSAPTVRLSKDRLATILPTIVGAGQKISERLCLAGR
jgi:IclR family acetate operon transcriptional repressor